MPRKRQLVPAEPELVQDGEPVLITEESGNTRTAYSTQREFRLVSETRTTTADATTTKIDHPPQHDDKPSKKRRRKRKKTTRKTPHIITARFLSEFARPYIDEMYAHHARPSTLTCSNCAVFGEVSYRCKSECLHRPLLCRTCLLGVHKHSPFHLVEEWDGMRFVQRLLKDLGMVVHLGHGGEPCSRGLSDEVEMTIVTSHCVQSARMRFCTICDIRPRTTELMAARLWPASFDHPRTAFTFEALDHFGHLSLQGHLTAYDFYKVIQRQTDNYAQADVENRYRELLLAHQQYSFLVQIIESGCDLDELTPGCLAKACPTCPHIKINIDPFWQQTPNDEKYIHALYYAKDGWFSGSLFLKRQDMRDRALSDGLAYYVQSDDYEKYLKLHHKEDPPTTTCSKFKAGNYPGKIASGQIMVMCARHGFGLANGLADLKKGERQCSVDYVTIHAACPYRDLPYHYSMYDIWCIWGVHFLKRMREHFPDAGELPPTIGAVPAFHQPAHTNPTCATAYNLRVQPGAGQTDGETLERGWGGKKGMAQATREMTPGHRQDKYNNHTSDQNMQKMFRIAIYLRKKYNMALQRSSELNERMETLETNLVDNGLPLTDWKATLADFRAKVVDPSFPKKELQNPYEPERSKAPTQREVLAALNQADALSRTEAVRVSSAPRGIGAMIQTALSVEQAQYEIRCRAKDTTVNQADSRLQKLEESRRRLEGQIRKLESQYEQVAGPTVATLQNYTTFDSVKWPRLPSEQTAEPESIILPVPSSFPSRVRKSEAFKPFVDAERALREAKANDILCSLRDKIGLQGFLRYATRDMNGQRNKTRNGSILLNAALSIEKKRGEYNHTFKILKVLGQDDSDKVDATAVRLRHLTKEECKVPVLRRDAEQLGWKHEKMSWLWLQGVSKETVDATESSDIAQWNTESTRVHWFRWDASRTRWEEELNLVRAEMRRAQRFFDYHERLWIRRALKEADGKTEKERGSSAFSASQAAMYRHLLAECRREFPAEELVYL